MGFYHVVVAIRSGDGVGLAGRIKRFTRTELRNLHKVEIFL